MDFQPSCGQPRPGRDLGFERRVSDSIDGDLTGPVFKRNATDDVSTASSDSTGMRRELENNILVMLRSALPSHAGPDIEGQLNPFQSPTKLPYPSFFQEDMSLQVTGLTWSRNDASDKDVPAKPLVVPLRSGMHLADEKQPCPLSGQTTLMIKHIPAAYTQRKLLRELTNAGFQGLIDFIYIPMDNRSRSNRGFAFCNFADGPTAAKFHERFHGSRLQYSGDTPALEIAAAEIQGFEENAKHFLIEKAANKGRESYSRPMFLRSLPAHLKHQLAEQGAAKVRTQVEVTKSYKKAADRSKFLPLCPLPAGEIATPCSYQESWVPPPSSFAALQRHRTGEVATPCSYQQSSVPLPSFFAALQRHKAGEVATPCSYQESSVPLPSSFAASQRRGTSQSHQVHFCHSCGQARQQTFSFCPYCGAAGCSRSQLEITSVQM